MAEIRSIHYRFYPGYLFNENKIWDKIDKEASAIKYAAELEKRLRQTYPNITVTIKSDPPSAISVNDDESLDLISEGSIDQLEAIFTVVAEFKQVLRPIADQVYKDWKTWLVPAE